MIRRLVCAALGLACAGALDVSPGARRGGPTAGLATPTTLLVELRSGAFPGEGHADAAVRVPPRFDPWERPGLVVYFHGWNGCVALALADEDAPCTPYGPARAASRLASQLDDAGVNALLVAVELRVDLPTGEVGALSQPGGLRALLGELFSEHLAGPLGRSLDVDSLDRVVVMAHSGGYQAAASVLRAGDVPRITEVVLLDALYGADAVFDAAFRDRSMRVIDLYTASGGTQERSRRGRQLALAEGRDVSDDAPELDPVAIAARLPRTLASHDVVVELVPVAHGDLTRLLGRSVLTGCGFAPAPGSSATM